ncbi:MAG: sugar phosphate nucleotidyltransferase [Syntrophales bacterium]|jgi:NDP-sugar pyrophosphorylase family protein
MKAVILAGGKGTRLAPYTTIFPKPLVPLGHRPILDIIIRQLAYYGFRRIVLNVGYLAELIVAYFQTANSQLPLIDLSYFKEPKPMGTAGSLKMIPDLNETFLVMNGDILTSMDYSKLVAYHKGHGGILTIGMHKKQVKIDLGVIEAGQDNILTGYIEKPNKEYSVSMGIYVYEPDVLKYIEPDTYLDFPTLVLRLIESGKKVVGYPCDDYWLDIGCHDDYIRAQDEFEQMIDIFLPEKNG